MTTALRGIFTAAEHYRDDDQLRAAIRIHTSGLNRAELIDTIEGLSGFAAAAWADTTSVDDAELRAARAEVIDLARAALAGQQEFRQRFAAIRTDLGVIAAAACHLVGLVATAVPDRTAEQVLSTVADVIATEDTP